MRGRGGRSSAEVFVGLHEVISALFLFLVRQLRAHLRVTYERVGSLRRGAHSRMRQNEGLYFFFAKVGALGNLPRHVNDTLAVDLYA